MLGPVQRVGRRPTRRVRRARRRLGVRAGSRQRRRRAAAATGGNDHLRAQRRLLKLDGDTAQLLDGARSAARAAVGDVGDRLAVPFAVDVVERVLQRRRVAVVVLSGDQHVSVRFGDLRRPPKLMVGLVALRRRLARVEERQVPLAQVDQFAGHVLALRRELGEPARNGLAYPPFADAADNDLNVRRFHARPRLRVWDALATGHSNSTARRRPARRAGRCSRVRVPGADRRPDRRARRERARSTICSGLIGRFWRRCGSGSADPVTAHGMINGSMASPSQRGVAA